MLEAFFDENAMKDSLLFSAGRAFCALACRLFCGGRFLGTSVPAKLRLEVCALKPDVFGARLPR
ncbi:MAG: hypothetical protein ACE5JS_18655, partial [Nitrospinota bacterium]